MATEIEHKYLVRDNTYREMSFRNDNIIQGYLSRDPERSVRIRIKNQSAFITVKGITHKSGRKEYEYPIPLTDAEELMRISLPGVISKTRYYVEYCNFIWEIDEFHDALEGLVLAEVEIPDFECEYKLPPFIGENVTEDSQYYNSSLSARAAESEKDS